jgi:hypothetical protein
LICGRHKAQAIDVFADKYRAKSARAVESPVKRRDALLAFYDFPAEELLGSFARNHIEIVFATVRQRTVREGFVVANYGQADVFKLITAASKAQISYRSSSQVSDSTTASRSSKCRQTTPDHLVSQIPHSSEEGVAGEFAGVVADGHFGLAAT